MNPLSSLLVSSWHSPLCFRAGSFGARLFWRAGRRGRCRGKAAIGPLLGRWPRRRRRHWRAADPRPMTTRHASADRIRRGCPGRCRRCWPGPPAGRCVAGPGRPARRAGAGPGWRPAVARRAGRWRCQRPLAPGHRRWPGSRCRRWRSAWAPTLPAWAWLLAAAAAAAGLPAAGLARCAVLSDAAPMRLAAAWTPAVGAAAARVLDAGCGLGHGLAALRRAVAAGASCTGVEWSPPLACAAALRCRWARVRRGDMWAASWAGLRPRLPLPAPGEHGARFDKAARETGARQPGW